MSGEGAPRANGWNRLRDKGSPAGFLASQASERLGTECAGGNHRNDRTYDASHDGLLIWQRSDSRRQQRMIRSSTAAQRRVVLGGLAGHTSCSLQPSIICPLNPFYRKTTSPTTAR
jgi:hypothetical protein